MKQISIILTLCCVLSLSAWEIKFFPSLQTNLSDQANFVPKNRPLRITTVSKVERGQPFTVNTSFMLKQPLKQPLKLSGKVELVSPDGKTHTALNWKEPLNVPAGARGIFILPRYVGVSFDPPDKPGKYRFILTLRDQNGNEKRAETDVELVNSITDFRMMDFKEFTSFARTYYMKPQPERLLAALNYFLSEGVIELRKNNKRSANILPLLYMFAQAFKRNPQFFDELAAMSGTERPKNQYFAVIFYHIGKPLLEKHKARINPHVLRQMSRFKKPFISDEEDIRFPQQIDMLWSEFFINGNFKSIKRIADCLRKRPELTINQAKELTAAGKKLTDEQKQQLLNFATRAGSAVSLLTNINRGHHLVKFYLETLCSRKMCADHQADQTLRSILNRSKSTQGNKK